MFSVLLFSSLWCYQTEVINLTKLWAKNDEAALELTKIRCNDIFGLEAPCLIRFTKTEERSYQAICGMQRKRENTFE